MKECKIIRDLIPNYIDGLTSKESNEFIEKHLETCDKCTIYLNDMKSNIELKEKETIKAEVDYMKKAKKKMNIGKKLLAIICLLFIIVGMLFWREIYQGCMYADICLKYMYWQEQIINNGSYKLTVRYTDSEIIYYANKDKVNMEAYDEARNLTIHHSYFTNSDIPNTKMIYTDATKIVEYDEKYKGSLKSYSEYPPLPQVSDEKEKPYFPFFKFEKASFWDLMKTYSDIISIRKEYMNGFNYYVLYLGYGQEIWFNRDTALPERSSDERYTLSVFENIDEKLVYPNEEDYTVLADYELENRSKEETDVKISNCEKEAGTIVSYDFKVPSNGNENLEGFFKTKYNNIRILKINNIYTYRHIQERWEGLRDLTEEDFKHYFVMIAIDTDNTKQISFKEMTQNEEQHIAPEKFLNLSETESINDFLYSGSLIIIPNSMDTIASGATIFAYDVTIE